MYDGLLTNDENTLDILVPEKYKNDAEFITSIYQEFMYFNNVEVENIYNKELNQKINEKKESDFIINIIYVPNDTKYNVYNTKIERNNIQNCIAIVINSKNYNRVQLNSIVNQGLYVKSDANVEDKIKTVYEENRYEDGYHSITSVTSLYNEYKNDKIAERIIIGFLYMIVILMVISIAFFIKKKFNK